MSASNCLREKNRARASTLELIYLMFNEGYAAQSGEDLVRHDLCGEALRLGWLLATSSLGTPQTHALVALMAFQAARLRARADTAGELVLLEDQDRRQWDRILIALGFDHFTQCAEGTEVLRTTYKPRLPQPTLAPKTGAQPTGS